MRGKPISIKPFNFVDNPKNMTYQH